MILHALGAMLYEYEALTRSHCRAIEFFRQKKDVAFFASQNQETHKYYKRTSVRGFKVRV